VRKKRKGKNV
jgi:hypothetical protein